MHLILKIGISRNTECVNTVGFPKLGHIFKNKSYNCAYYVFLNKLYIHVKKVLKNPCYPYFKDSNIRILLSINASCSSTNVFKMDFLKYYGYTCLFRSHINP